VAAPLLTLQSTRSDQRIAHLAALAIAVHVLESVLPSPLPGIKPGLANVVVIVVLCRFGFAAAAWVSLLRVLVGALVIGTLLGPTFYLSLTGALGALAALGLGRALPGIGPIGLAVLASLAHMAAQFATAYTLLIPHPALWKLLPVFMTAALGFGIVSGAITATVLHRLVETEADGQH
jgi:heptaprenyl diphosphate synthase